MAARPPHCGHFFHVPPATPTPSAGAAPGGSAVFGAGGAGCGESAAAGTVGAAVTAPIGASHTGQAAACRDTGCPQDGQGWILGFWSGGRLILSYGGSNSTMQALTRSPQP